MAKVYIIKELYDVDGGFGDAVVQENVMFVTMNGELAKAYVEKYSKPVVYDKPYAYLTEHELICEEMDIVDPDLDVDPWKDKTRAWHEDFPIGLDEEYEWKI